MNKQAPDDFYAILGIDPAASATDIRRAYRMLAKKHHPDKNPGSEDLARVVFERIRRAYETLSDPRQRLIHDRRRRPRPTERVPERPDELAAWTLELLLAEQASDALLAFDRFLRKTNGSAAELDLPKYLDYPDARDCEFLLAEALEGAGRDDDAAALYERSLQRERRRPYFRAFADEIRFRLKRLRFRRFLLEAESPEWNGSVEESLRPVFRLGVTARERAGWYKSAAEALLARRPDAAREALQRALTFHPKMTGVKKLSRRLNLDVETGEPLHVVASD